MFKAIPCSLSALLLASSAHAMVWVGTPVGFAPDGHEDSFTAHSSADTVVLHDCSGGSVSLNGPSALPDGALFNLPAGTWCGVDFVNLALHIEGDLLEGGTVNIDAALPLVALALPAPLNLQAGNPPAITWMAEDWIDALGLDPEADTVIQPGGALHEDLADLIALDSTW